MCVPEEYGAVVPDALQSLVAEKAKRPAIVSTHTVSSTKTSVTDRYLSLCLPVWCVVLKHEKTRFFDCMVPPCSRLWHSPGSVRIWLAPALGTRALDFRADDADDSLVISCVTVTNGAESRWYAGAFFSSSPSSSHLSLPPSDVFVASHNVCLIHLPRRSHLTPPSTLSGGSWEVSVFFKQSIYHCACPGPTACCVHTHKRRRRRRSC